MCHIALLLPIISLPLFWLLPTSVAIASYLVVLAVSALMYFYAFKACRLPLAMGPETISGGIGTVAKVDQDQRYLIRFCGELWQATGDAGLRVGDRARIVQRQGNILRIVKTGGAPDPGTPGP